MFKILKKNDITMFDVKELNQDIISYIEEQGEEYFIEKNNKIVIENLNSIDVISKKLTNDGIVVLPNFLDASYCLEIEEFLLNCIMNYKKNLNKNLFFEDELALIQLNKAKLSGYDHLKNYTKSVINIRNGLDEGMIDIFNVDKLNKDLFIKVKEFVNSEFMSKLFSMLGINGKCNNINAYINDNITQTRGFHADSYSTQYKIFFYLTDILSFSDGPYTYVRETHKDSIYRTINKNISSNLENKTETPILPYSNIHPILGYKGSMVISNQSGSHRGYPQQINAHRMILSLNIT